MNDETTHNTTRRGPLHKTGERAEQAAMHIVKTLQQAGHIAYFAGGCVRDMLRGQQAKDFDIATDATPQQVSARFRNARLVGEAFGVVLIRHDGCEIEVATFRAEAEYTDNRHPQKVRFTDPKTDAQRRDFTINGLFYDPIGQQVHDYINGQADLKQGIIRAIGDPHERFAEDYLRMLRAVRFTCRLGFTLDTETRHAIEAHAAKLTAISRERIGMEIFMMLSHASRGCAVRLMRELKLEDAIIAPPTVLRRLMCLDALPDALEPIAALAAWTLDRQLKLPDQTPITLTAMIDAVRLLKPVKLTRHWRNALVLSNEQSDHLRNLLEQLHEALRWDVLNVAERKRLLAGAAADLFKLRDALLGGYAVQGFDREQFEAERTQLETEGVAPQPWIDGRDLMSLGLEPGPVFKRILREVYDAQLMGQVTDKASAMDRARDLASAMQGEGGDKQ